MNAIRWVGKGIGFTFYIGLVGILLWKAGMLFLVVGLIIMVVVGSRIG